MVQKCGVMYRDTVKGKFRLFFHHVNDTDSSKRLAIVLRRTGIRPALVQLGRMAFQILTVTGWKPEKRPRSATMASKRKQIP